MYKQGDVVVPFPFSDQSGKKVRPVLVISNNDFNKASEDLVVVGITSNIFRDKYTSPLKSEDLDEGYLVTESCIKVESILKIDKGLIIKEIGKVTKNKLKEVNKILNDIVKID